MIKGIIFDMGGVVLTDRLESVLSSVANKLELNEEEFINFFNRYKDDLLKGKLRVVQFADLTKKKFNINKDIIEIWKKCYLDLMNVNQGLLDKIKRLRKNYKIGIITNTSDLHAELNMARGIFDSFDEVVISCKIGSIKPEQFIFDEMLKRLNLQAYECIFIDDRQEHLDIPRKIGFKVVLFKDNLTLFEELKKLGVKLDFGVI